MRAVWIASIILRAIAVLCARPSLWRLWAIFYVATGIILKALDSMHYGTAYYWLWMVQQITSATLLLSVVIECCPPDRLLGVMATLSAAVLSTAFYVGFNWPAEPIEYVILVAAFLSLAGGMFSACSLLRTFRIHRAILATYMLLGAAILFVTPEYMAEPGIGLDVALLDCIAFGMWAGLFSVDNGCIVSPER